MDESAAMPDPDEYAPTPSVIGAWWDAMNRPDHLVLADWARVAKGRWVAYSLVVAALLVSAGIVIQDLAQPLLPSAGELAIWPPTAWLPGALRIPGYLALFVLVRSILYLCPTLGVAAVFALFVPRPLPDLRAALGRALVPWALAQPGFGITVLVASGTAAGLSALSGLPQVDALHGILTGAMVRGAVALLTLVLATGLFARLHRLMVQSSWAATGKRGGAMIVAAWLTYLGVALLVGSLLQASMGLLLGAPR